MLEGCSADAIFAYSCWEKYAWRSLSCSWTAEWREHPSRVLKSRLSVMYIRGLADDDKDIFLWVPTPQREMIFWSLLNMFWVELATEVDLRQNLKNCSKSLTFTLRSGLWDRCSLNYFSQNKLGYYLPSSVYPLVVWFPNICPWTHVHLCPHLSTVRYEFRLRQGYWNLHLTDWILF